MCIYIYEDRYMQINIHINIHMNMYIYPFQEPQWLALLAQFEGVYLRMLI
jgi:hypothetical protein